MGVELFNSKRNTYTRCQRNFYYSYIKDGTGYQKVVSDKPLDFGTLCHSAREHFYATDGDIALDGIAEEWLRQRNRQIAKAKKRKYISEEYISTKLDETDDMLDMYHAIMPPYLEAREEDFDQYDVVMVEKELRFPLGAHHFNGIPDLVLKDKKTGMIWVDDFKTTASEPNKFLQDKIFDVQNIGYIWMLRNELGRCDGFMYDALYKKPIGTPRTVQCKSCKGSGELKGGPCRRRTVADKKTGEEKMLGCDQTGIGGMAKGKCLTTEAMFREEVARYPHLNIDDYEEQIGAIRKLEFWKREIISVSDQQIADWEYGTENIADDIQWATDQKYEARDFQKNYTACCGIGMKCEFRYVCLFSDTATMDEFEPRKTRYASEDAQGE